MSIFKNPLFQNVTAEDMAKVDISKDLSFWNRSLEELRDTYLYQAAGNKVARDGMGNWRIEWRRIQFDNKFESFSAARKHRKLMRRSYIARAACVELLIQNGMNANIFLKTAA